MGSRIRREPVCELSGTTEPAKCDDCSFIKNNSFFNKDNCPFKRLVMEAYL